MLHWKTRGGGKSSSFNCQVETREEKIFSGFCKKTSCDEEHKQKSHTQGGLDGAEVSGKTPDTLQLVESGQAGARSGRSLGFPPTHQELQVSWCTGDVFCAKRREDTGHVTLEAGDSFPAMLLEQQSNSLPHRLGPCQSLLTHNNGLHSAALNHMAVHTTRQLIPRVSTGPAH